MNDVQRYREMPQYLRPSMRAPYRLQALKNQGLKECGKNWRNVRAWGYQNWHSAFAALSQCGNGQWYCHTGAQFRDERFADECDEGRPDHTGWLTNSNGATYKDGSGIARGIVARLTHGRFIAGYHWGDNGERVYFPAVFTDEGNAARMADEHARVFAESAQEDSARFERMQNAETECEDAAETLRDIWALRRTGRRGSDDVCESIEALRAAREELATARAEYERG